MAKDRRKQSTQTEHTYQSLVESIKDYAIFVLDKKGKIVSWNQGGVKLFGYKRNEIIGKNFSVLFTKEDIKKGVPDSDLVISFKEGRHLDERQYVRKNKTIFWSNGVLTSMRDRKGTNQGFSKIMRDVTQQNDLHKAAIHNSTHDFLTGLPNRNFFEEHLIESIQKTKKGNILAVLYMDFNHFKQTNDEEGHGFGDLVLIEIARRLRHKIRMSDMVARIGGDEFVVLAKQLNSEADAARIADKLVQAFDAPIVVQKRAIRISVSIGVALYPSNEKMPGKLLRFADMALLKAKKLGGDQYQFYTKEPVAGREVPLTSSSH